MAVLTQAVSGCRLAPFSHHARPRLARGSLRVAAFALPRLDVEEGPGTGQRHYPDPQRGQFEPRRAPPASFQDHDMMSTEECYRLFPLLIHSSVPLRIEDLEPAGRSATRLTDAGPATGQRRRPAPADSPAGANNQVLPYPATRPTDLRRELLARHAPEVLLEGQRRAQA